jgi:hypothetical protein
VLDCGCLLIRRALGSLNLPWRRSQIPRSDSACASRILAPPARFDSTTATPAPATHLIAPSLPFVNKHRKKGRKNFLLSRPAAAGIKVLGPPLALDQSNVTSGSPESSPRWTEEKILKIVLGELVSPVPWATP